PTRSWQKGPSGAVPVARSPPLPDKTNLHGGPEGPARGRCSTCTAVAPRRAWTWAALAPAAAAGALLTVAWPRLWPQPSEASVADAVVAAHVRSLLANHLTDVASSDQHTVKPWFQGKLDYSVSVTDWADEGFPLVGGRLDYVEA